MGLTQQVLDSQIIELLQLVFRVLILGTTMVLLLERYKQTLFRNLIHLFSALVPYLLIDLLYLPWIFSDHIYLIRQPSWSEAYFYFYNSFSMTMILVSTYIIWIFLDGFEKDNMFRPLNLAMLILVFSLVGGTFYTSLAVIGTPFDSPLLQEGFPRIADMLSLLFGQQISYPSKLYLSSWLVFTLVYMAISTMVVLLMISNFYRMTQKIRGSRGDARKKFIRMHNALLVNIVGSVLFFFTTQDYWYTLEIVGLCLFVYYYLSGELLLSSRSRLHQLIVINDKGMPIYNYEFADHDPPSGKLLLDDTLFVGILSAINKIMNEFTGLEQEFREIRMSRSYLLARKLARQHAVLLVIDDPSQSIRSALDAFSLSIYEHFQTQGSIVQVFKDESLDELVRRYFDS